MFLVPIFVNICQDSHELEMGENTQRAFWSLKVTFFPQESESGLKQSLAVHSALVNVPLTYMCVCVCVPPRLYSEGARGFIPELRGKAGKFWRSRFNL